MALIGPGLLSFSPELLRHAQTGARSRSSSASSVDPANPAAPGPEPLPVIAGGIPTGSRRLDSGNHFPRCYQGGREFVCWNQSVPSG